MHNDKAVQLFSAEMVIESGEYCTANDNKRDQSVEANHVKKWPVHEVKPIQSYAIEKLDAICEASNALLEKPNADDGDKRNTIKSPRNCRNIKRHFCNLGLFLLALTTVVVMVRTVADSHPEKQDRETPYPSTSLTTLTASKNSRQRSTIDMAPLPVPSALTNMTENDDDAIIFPDERVKQMLALFSQKFYKVS